jgi:hypothetical protein
MAERRPKPKAWKTAIWRNGGDVAVSVDIS